MEEVEALFQMKGGPLVPLLLAASTLVLQGAEGEDQADDLQGQEGAPGSLDELRKFTVCECDELWCA